MKTILLYVLTLATLVISCPNCSEATDATPAGADTGVLQKADTEQDYEALAQKLVANVGVHEGDIVRITGGVRDTELLEDLAVNVRQLGAFPLVTISSDRMNRRMYTDVPPKFDSQPRDLGLKLTNIITAQISVSYEETDSTLAGISPERIEAVKRANAPVTELGLKRNIRYLNLGNDFYPTPEHAKQFGISQQELSKIFWEAVNIDYTKLQATGTIIKKTLNSSNKLHITNPNGTDLKIQIEGRPVFISDGVISADNIKRGGAAVRVWLPAGEVYLTPIPGTAEGKVVVDRYFYEGKEIEGITITFKVGKLTSMTAKSGLERLKAVYDAAGRCKDLFSALDIGINPKVQLPHDSRQSAYMQAGMITVGIGNNTWAGGNNNCSFGVDFFLPGSTMKANGKLIVENGKLKL